MFNAILSHPQQTSWVSVERADDYHSVSMEAETWSALTDATKKASLIQATKVLDAHPLFTLGIPVYRSEPWVQSTKVPGSKYQKRVTGTVDSAGTNTLVDDALADATKYRSGQFVEGAVRITGGAGATQVVRVTAFDVSKGSVTVDGNWSPALDSTSAYTLIEPIPGDLEAAICDFAAMISTGGIFDQLNEHSLGGSAQSPGKIAPNLIPAEIRSRLAPYFTTSVALA